MNIGEEERVHDVEPEPIHEPREDDPAEAPERESPIREEPAREKEKVPA